MGRDDFVLKSLKALQDFNPRAPVGRDTLDVRLVGTCSDFNPRAPVGRDRNILYHLLQLYIFNNNFDSINSEKNSFSITFYLNPISKNV